METPAVEAMDDPRLSVMTYNRPAGSWMIWFTSVAANPSASVYVVMPFASNADGAPQIRAEPYAAGSIDRYRVDRLVGQTVGFIVRYGTACHRTC